MEKQITPICCLCQYKRENKKLSPICGVVGFASTSTAYGCNACVSAWKKKRNPKDFKNAELCSIDFGNADLSGADFTGAKLVHVNFTGANLKGAVFVGAKITRVNFTGADITGAVFSAKVIR